MKNIRVTKNARVLGQPLKKSEEPVEVRDAVAQRAISAKVAVLVEEKRESAPPENKAQDQASENK